MKIEDKIKLSYEVEAMPGDGGTEEQPFEEDEISNLISLLKDKGIMIDTSNSEKDIIYLINGTSKKSTVPLDSTFDRKVKIDSFTLRGDGLEIIAENSHSKGYSGGAFGGPYYIDLETTFKLLFEGESEGILTIQKAREVIEEFYLK